MTSKFHSLRIKDIRQETDECVSIAFDIPADKTASFAFKPGQYLNIKTVVDGEEIRRSYSLCSAPSENEWRIAVKQIEKGKFSNYAKTLKVDDVLEISTPLGNFTTELNTNNKKEYLLAAAGSGITPVISLIKEILITEPESTITLFYGNRSANTIIFREQLEALYTTHPARFRLIHVFSRDNAESELLKGRIDAEKFNLLWDAYLIDKKIDEVFVCGPEQMILDVKDASIQRGVPENTVHFELFETSLPKDTPAREAVRSHVTAIMDDDEYDFFMEDAEVSVLDAGIEAGADLPYSCKGGVCCTCRAKILEGEAVMDINYALTPEEVEQGYILTCQSHPTTDRLVVSYDE